MTKNSAPQHLCKAGASLWVRLHAEFVIDDEGGKLLLQTTCEAFCRMREAQALIDAEGAVLADRFGQRKPHPAVAIERDSRTAMLASLKQLGLDVEPAKSGPGRPPGTWNFTRSDPA